MLLGMMSFNSVNAQTEEELLQQLRTDRLKNAIASQCYDDEEFMAEIGYADGMANRNLAQKNALANCQSLLKMRLEQVVQGVMEDFSSRTELSSGATFTDAELRDLNVGFHSVIEKSIGRTIKCYSTVQKNEKGTFDGVYNAKISIDEFVKKCEDVIDQDAALRAKTNLGEFKDSMKENFKKNEKTE